MYYDDFMLNCDILMNKWSFFNIMILDIIIFR